RILSPETTTRETLEKLLREKLLWIYGKLGRKEEELRRAPRREFVTGEGFYYLGKKHRLKVLSRMESACQTRQLSLHQGRFFLREDALDKAREQFVRWYAQRAAIWLTERMTDLAERVGAQPAAFECRDLANRWGSCTENGKVLIHWRAMMLPPTVIRYLVLHELVHLIEHNHSPDFYSRLRAAVPDFQKQEEWLRLHGDDYDL
ncbi:MAG: M48 family metallopeptidase, partial [Sumerlaeia bacterium]